MDELDNIWIKGSNHGSVDSPFEWDVQLSTKGINKLKQSSIAQNKIDTAIKKGYINIDIDGNLSH